MERPAGLQAKPVLGQLGKAAPLTAREQSRARDVQLTSCPPGSVTAGPLAKHLSRKKEAPGTPGDLCTHHAVGENRATSPGTAWRKPRLWAP